MFVAVHSGTLRRSYALRLAKAGVRDRAAEDAVASRLLVRALAEAASVEAAADVDLALMGGSEGAAPGTEELHVGVTCCVPFPKSAHRPPKPFDSNHMPALSKAGSELSASMQHHV